MFQNVCSECCTGPVCYRCRPNAEVGVRLAEPTGPSPNHGSTDAEQASALIRNLARPIPPAGYEFEMERAKQQHIQRLFNSDEAYGAAWNQQYRAIVAGE